MRRWLGFLVAIGCLAAAAGPLTAQEKSISRMWTGAMLAGKSGWGSYSGGGDSVPGAMSGMATDPAAGAKAVYRLPINPPLPAGTYKILIKEFHGGRVSFGLAGTTSEPLTYARHVSAGWSGLVLTITAPAPELALTFQPTLKPEQSPTQNIILQGIYITTDLNEIIGRDDIIRSGAGPVLAPGQVPPPPLRTDNYLENSSFELGIGHGWGKVWINQWDDSTAADGRYSLRLPVIQMWYSTLGYYYRLNNQSGFESKFYRLPPGRYTLSAYLKADKACSVNLRLFGHPEKATQDGPGRTAGGGRADLTTEWKRFAFTFDVPEGPGNFWAVGLNMEWRTINLGFKVDSSLEEIRKADLPIPQNVWVDALQLERAETASPYRPRGGVEVGILCRQPGHILYENEPANLELLVYNPGKNTGTLEATWRIEDYFDRPVREETFRIPLRGETHLSRKPAVPLDRRGIFRMLAWTREDAAGPDELSFSILPPNRHLNILYEPGRMGTDTGSDPNALAILKRANCNWVISKGIGRMEGVMPEPGKYRWSDEALQNVLDAKIMMLGQVFVNNAPAYLKPYCGTNQGWEPEKKKRYLEIWGNYVYDLVSHYREKIRHWEVTNEPYFWCTPEDYADILRVASERIRQVDPGIKVIGFCSGNMPAYFPRAVRAADPKWYDGVSGHFYDTDPVKLRYFASVLKKYDKSGWQTEAGPTFPSFYKTLPTLQQLYGEEHHANPSSQGVRDSNIRTLQGELRCFAIGAIDHYFHYFSRFGNTAPTETTRRPGGGKEDVEYDGSLRPYAVGRSIASHLLEDARHYAEWRVTLGLFEKGGQTVGVVWSVDGRLLEIRPETAGGWQVYDWCGNKLALGKDGSFQVDRFPRYFTVAAPPAQVAGMLDRGTVRGWFNVDARLVPAPTGTGFALNLLLHNEKESLQRVSIILGGRLGGFFANPAELQNLEIQGKENRRLILLLTGTPGGRVLDLAVMARGTDFSIDFPFTFSLAAAQAAAGLDEVAGRGPDFSTVTIRTGPGNRMSPADYTPRFEAGYDAVNLYLAADITDDLLSPVPGNIPGERHDQVHFLIAAETAERRSSNNPRETLGRVASRSDCFVVLAPKAGGGAAAELRRGDGTVEKIESASFTATAGGYRLAVAVPWEKLGMAAPKPGSSLVFNAVAFDADGVNPDWKTEWPWAGGPEFEYANPAGWGELLFR